MHGSDPSDHELCEGMAGGPGGRYLAASYWRTVSSVSSMVRAVSVASAPLKNCSAASSVSACRVSARCVSALYRKLRAGGARYDITYIQGWHAPITFFHSDS